MSQYVSTGEFDITTYMEGKIAELDTWIARDDERWEALSAQKDADFAAAAQEGKTPAEYYISRGFNPDHTPLKKPMNPMILWGVGAFGVLFLLARTK